MVNNLFKSYRCDHCGYEKYYVSHDMLSKKRNIIADNCPKCFFGSMVINFDDETNFKDNYIDKHYNEFFEHLDSNMIGV